MQSPPAPSVTTAPVLETDRLILRGHRSSDFQDCAAMWADPEIVRHICPPASEEQAWSRLLRYTGHWQHMGFGYWVVTSKTDGAYLGEVGFANYKRNTKPSFAGTPEAGWVIARHAHGKGFASEAVAAMLTWADTQLKAEQTVAMIVPEHVKSIRLARSFGFGDEVSGQNDDHTVLIFKRPQHGR